MCFPTDQMRKQAGAARTQAFFAVEDDADGPVWSLFFLIYYFEFDFLFLFILKECFYKKKTDLISLIRTSSVWWRPLIGGSLRCVCVCVSVCLCVWVWVWVCVCVCLCVLCCKQTVLCSARIQPPTKTSSGGVNLKKKINAHTQVMLQEIVHCPSPGCVH